MCELYNFFLVLCNAYQYEVIQICINLIKEPIR